MTWLENDRRHWDAVRRRAKIDTAIATALGALIVAALCFFIWVVVGIFLGPHARLAAAASERGSIVCDEEGHVAVKNIDVKTPRLTLGEFVRKMENLCTETKGSI